MITSTSDNADLKAIEVAQLLRDVVEGKRTIRLADEDLPWSTEGNIPFTADGWTIVCNNNLMALNYIDSATAPDGRHARFDDWPQNPQNLLTWTEVAALDQLLEKVGR